MKSEAGQKLCGECLQQDKQVKSSYLGQAIVLQLQCSVC